MVFVDRQNSCYHVYIKFNFLIQIYRWMRLQVSVDQLITLHDMLKNWCDTGKSVLRIFR